MSLFLSSDGKCVIECANQKSDADLCFASYEKHSELRIEIYLHFDIGFRGEVER